MNPRFCPYCGGTLSLDYLFCPQCGKLLKDPTLTFSKQLSVYALSVFLPPFGLWPGIKYLLKKDPKVKVVGIIAIVLTILSTAVTFWMVSATVDQINSSVNVQLDQLHRMGY